MAVDLSDPVDWDGVFAAIDDNGHDARLRLSASLPSHDCLPARTSATGHATRKSFSFPQVAGPFDPGTMRTAAQADAARANGNRGSGPRTNEGKDRVSANRAEHGLTGFALVLPGETVEGYRGNQDRWAGALRPTTGPEVQLVAQLADLAWRLDRCARLEHRKHLAAVEDALAKKAEFVNFSLVQRALQPINLLVEYGEGAVASASFTGTAEDLGHLAAAARGTVNVVRDVEVLPEKWVGDLDDAVEDFAVAVHKNRATADQLRRAIQGAKRIQSVLVQKATAAEEQLGNLRAELAKTTIPTDADSKKLARYRGELERSQARLLGVLQQVREQIKLAQTSGAKTMPPLRLRVVK